MQSYALHHCCRFWTHFSILVVYPRLKSVLAATFFDKGFVKTIIGEDKMIDKGSVSAEE